MPQFTVYENADEETKDAIPCLLDVQSEILEGLKTRVVVPMCPSSAVGNKPMSDLSPSFEIMGVMHVLLTPQLSGISLSQLGPPICDLSEFRFQIINALDFLLTGF